MEKTHIWIDADSCPALVRNHSIKIANQLGLKITLVANKNIPCSRQYPYEMKIVSAEKDAADNFILENLKENDLVITKDIIFADKIVAKGIKAINDRGTVFCKDNIKELLSERNYDFALAQAGVVKHYNEGYDKKKFAAFANCFDKIIHNLVK